jgi:hypothetical protein
LTGRDLIAQAHDPDDVRAHLLDRGAERLEHAGGEPFLLAEQPEQDVLGADVVVLEKPRLVLTQDDDLACAFGEALEHRREPSPSNTLVTGIPFAGLARSWRWLRVHGRRG